MWSLLLEDIDSIAVVGRQIPISEDASQWDWDVRIWTRQPLDPTENPAERRTFGDLTLAADRLQAFEVGARLAVVIHDPRSGIEGF